MAYGQNAPSCDPLVTFTEVSYSSFGLILRFVQKGVAFLISIIPPNAKFPGILKAVNFPPGIWGIL